MSGRGLSSVALPATTRSYNQDSAVSADAVGKPLQEDTDVFACILRCTFTQYSGHPPPLRPSHDFLFCFLAFPVRPCGGFGRVVEGAPGRRVEGKAARRARPGLGGRPPQVPHDALRAFQGGMFQSVTDDL